MRKNVLEMMGFISGYIVGLLAAILSAFRAARVFHPEGLLFEATVENLEPNKLKFHENALIRLSGTFWKTTNLPDGVGVSIRFSKEAVKKIELEDFDQDLLFVSFDRPMKILMAPLITNYKNYLMNEYFTILPFTTVNWEHAYFKLISSNHESEGENRNERIFQSMMKKKAWFVLMGSATREDWEPLAKLTLINSSFLDQEA